MIARIFVVTCGVAVLAALLTVQQTPEAAPAPPPPAPHADVRSFGARGDGTTDDTAAIQNAVNSGLGLVHFPRGVYRIEHSIVLDLRMLDRVALEGDTVARVLMAGEGPAFRVVGTHGGSAAPGTFKPGVLEQERMPSIDGLEILGGHDNADGIEATGTMQLTLTRLTVRNCRHGIRLPERNRNVIISDCQIYHNRGVGIFLDRVNLHQINITGSHVSYNHGGGIVVRGGQVRNLHITGCDVEANHGPDGPPTANILVDNTGGTNAEVAITGCTIQHTQKAPDSANIRIVGPSTSNGSPELRDGHVTITGNIMSDTQVNIHLKHARGVTIQGNTCWTAVKHTLLVENCSNVVVGPNNLDRNPRYFREEDNAADAVLFRDCEDCTISGLQVLGVRKAPAGVVLEKCRRFNLTGLSILDCDHGGLWLKDVANSRVSDCLIRDDRPQGRGTFSIKAEGGHGNMIVDNSLNLPSEIPAGVGLVERNMVNGK